MKELVEQYVAVKKALMAVEEKEKELKEKKADIERQMLDKLNESNQDGTIIGDIKVTRTDRRVYNAEDWAKVHTYIEHTKDYSILQARLSSTRLKELEKDGYSMEAIGVKPTDLQEVTVKKSTRW